MNPFEDPNAQYYALVNDEGQYSLWPALVDIPAGWTVSRGVDTRDACLTHITEHWTDMRPKSLVNAMENPNRSD